MRSDEHKGLSQSYRHVRERDINNLIEMAGHVPIRSIKDAHIRKDMMSLEPHPANERLKTWRAVMKFAKQEGYRSNDPSEFVKRRKTAEEKPHEPWTIEDKEAFRGTFLIGTRERLAMEVLNWTGARMSDVVRFSDGMVDRSGWLNFIQQKTKGKVSLPVYPVLPDFLDPDDLTLLKSCLDARTERPLWLTTAYCSSRSPKAASQWFAKKARVAGFTKKRLTGFARPAQLSWQKPRPQPSRSALGLAMKA